MRLPRKENAFENPFYQGPFVDLVCLYDAEQRIEEIKEEIGKIQENKSLSFDEKEKQEEFLFKKIERLELLSKGTSAKCFV